jgi:excisionase family DNA binding protein
VKLLTPVEVADMLRVSRRTVQNMIERGDLPAAKVGRFWRVAEGDIIAYLRKHMNNGHRGPVT